MTAYVQGKVCQCDFGSQGQSSMWTQQKQHKSIIFSNLKYIKYPFPKMDNLNLRVCLSLGMSK